jgi:hypothetical protein
VSGLPYIPPSSPGDPIPEELAVLFLEAVGRGTPAFRELRDQVFPKCDADKNHFPLDDIEAWLHTWRLDIGDGEFAHLVHDLAIGVLRHWAAYPDARKALAVDCGLWEYLESPSRRVSGDTILPGWNPYRETYDHWHVRMVEVLRKHCEAELEKYGATPYGPQNELAFEWLALSLCRRLSDGEIAKKYSAHKVTREAVKKARTRLAKRLHILP